jgi:hypothetical protein
LTVAAAPSSRMDIPDEDMSAASTSSSSLAGKNRQRPKLIAFLTREERCNFETLGCVRFPSFALCVREVCNDRTLLDCSRNGVLTVDSVKFFLRQQALIGCNLLHLYTECVVASGPARFTNRR